MPKKKTSKAAKPPRTRDLGPPPEAFEGLDAWASEVAKCVTDAELELLIGIHRRIANDRKVSAENRRLAREQAKALRKCKNS